MKHETINSIVALLGLGVAGFTAWHQFYPALFPSSRTVAAVSTTQWSVKDGPFGRGPSLLARVSFSNLGSASVTVRSMRVKYALGSGELENVNCRSTKFTWAGIPWNSVLRGQTFEQAIAINVAPNIPVTEVISFEAASLLSEADKQHGDVGSVFACLEIDTLDPNLQLVSVRHPIGTVSYSENSIVDFRMHDNARSGFTIRE